MLLARRGEFEAAQGEGKGERARFAGAAKAIEENEEMIGGVYIVARAGPPGAGVPTLISRSHDLNGAAPFRETRGRRIGAAPPEPSRGRRDRLGNVDAGKDSFEVVAVRDDGEVEELEFGRGKRQMLRPTDAVFAFGVALDEIVVEIGARDIPEFPFAVVEEEIRFVDTSLLPRLVGNEDWRRLIDPDIAIPFEKANSVRSPELAGGACVVDPLDRYAPVRVPAFDIRGTVSTTAKIPGAASTVAGE